MQPPVFQILRLLATFKDTYGAITGGESVESVTIAIARACQFALGEVPHLLLDRGCSSRDVLHPRAQCYQDHTGDFRLLGMFTLGEEQCTRFIALTETNCVPLCSYRVLFNSIINGVVQARLSPKTHESP